MWRAIIVDDEEFVREDIISQFPWQEYHFELVGQAENGNAAQSLIYSTRPHLILTDIRMPEMDGLALTAWVHENAPQTIVVVISAFNDFPYVREALRLGAFDYMMKAEVSSDTAGVLLARVVKKLSHQEAELAEQLILNDTVRRYNKLAISTFWRELLVGALEETELAKQTERLGINPTSDRYGLIMVHLYHGSKLSVVDCQQWENKLKECLAKNWPEQCHWWLVEHKRGEWVIVGSFPPGIITDEGEFSNTPDMIAGRLFQIDSNTLTISTLEEVYPIGYLPKAFQVVCEINFLRLYFGGTGCFSKKQLLKIQQAPLPKIPDLLKDWEQVLRSVETETGKELLRTIFGQIVPNLLPTQARLLLLDLIGVLRRVALEQQISWEQLESDTVNYLEMIELAESCQDWYEWLQLLSQNYMGLVKKAIVSPNSVVIQKALAFIQINFTRDLTLQEVADQAGASKSFLSRIFPEYVGEHFSDYLLRLRLEKAKELLRFTNLRIYEVGNKVGFWNVRYFSRVFRKREGVTPADYRWSFSKDVTKTQINLESQHSTEKYLEE